MDYNKWLEHTFSSSVEVCSDYILFQKEMKKDLKKIASQNVMALHSFNKNHYEFSAVLKDENSDSFIYVSIPDVRVFKNEWFNNVLVRTMKHERDWTGGRNHFCKWIDVGEKARELLNTKKKEKENLDLGI